METLKIPDTYKYIGAFLTMRCNLHCSYCNNDFYGKLNRKSFKEISGEKWIEVLNKIESRPDVPITFEGGEPFFHKDFIYIINNLKPELNIDILTNLYFGEKKLEEFIKKVNPDRIKRNVPYPSIRVSYHPQQMRDPEKLLKRVKKLQEEGFSIGIEGIMYLSDEQLIAIEQMAAECRNQGISFRPKSYIGIYEGIDDFKRPFSKLCGNYSKYPDSVKQEKTKSRLCRISDLLIRPDMGVHKCHRDLYLKENLVGNMTDSNFQIKYRFRECDNYGQCHPCDVKVKTNYQQELGHTSVDIENIR